MPEGEEAPDAKGMSVTGPYGGLVWRKATASTDHGACLEFAETRTGDVLVRDSKDPNGDVLVFTRREFAAWINGAKMGEFDYLVA